MLLMGVVYLIIDKYNYFIIPKRKLSYLLLNCYLICCYFFLSVKLCFLMSSEVCKECREYRILHQTSTNNNFFLSQV